MARLTQKSLDDAFARGGTATDAYEGIQKRRQEASESQLGRDAALSQLIKGQELKDTERTQSIDQAQGLRKLLGKDASIRVGDVSMDPRNYESAKFQQGMADKDADNRRLETAAVQSEYNKISGKSREQMQALKEIEGLLANPSAVTEGQLRTALARAGGDVGALSEGDVQRTLPRTMGADIKGAWNYVTGGTESRLSPEQIKAVNELVRAKKLATQSRMGASEREIRTRAQTLAPTLSRSGEVESVLRGLGSGVDRGGEDDKAAKIDAVMKRIQELEAKKAGG